MPGPGNTEALLVHLSELAESLQAASNYLEALKARSSLDADPNKELLARVEQQLNRVQEGFHGLRDHLITT